MKPIIIGAGLAGLSTALAMAPMPVMLLSPRKLGEECSSSLAQGGISAAVSADDSALEHAADTLNAGAGLCDADIVRQVTEDGAATIENLVKYGAQFDRDKLGQLQLGLEAAHGRRRIVHAADGTGAAVMKAMIAAARVTPSIEIIENVTVVDIIADDGVRGVNILHDGNPDFIPADRVVLATGGVGGLWQHTTNPLSSWGRGLALAARAGAELADLEFMQFHPTAIDVGRDPMPLASEALRGEGAVLIDETGSRFTDELQSRDIVARAIYKHLKNGHRVFLDARQNIGASFPQHFPGIYKSCMAGGIDPLLMPIPVRPAAHYHMGGVKTDANGRSSVKGLWACGEVACTGLHGANRLASNSLLEAAACGQRVAQDIKGAETSTKTQAGEQLSFARSIRPDPYVRALMSQHVGVTRDGAGLKRAIEELIPLAHRSDMALAGLMIATAAVRREESRGAQCRTDFPNLSAQAVRQTLKLADVLPDLMTEPKRAFEFA